MNYRHAYHAGNHADVLKHVVLARVLLYLLQKDKPLAVLDAHAGIGRYDLKGAEAYKTGEWKDGIGKLLAEPLPENVRTLLAIYLNIIHDLNPDGSLRIYPGSPEIIARLLRRSDRIILNELHPADADTLAARYAADKRVRVTRVDAGQAARAELPFAERRGVVLVDPAFEVAGEMEKMSRMLGHIHARMQNTTILAWYPLKGEDAEMPLLEGATALPCAGTLAIELRVKEAFAEGGLAGSGLVVVNPPHTLKAEIETILPVLAGRMGFGKWGRGSVRELTPPR
jgi:23S rRNA (adenine2030-N6)-methyltransferase